MMPLILKFCCCHKRMFFFFTLRLHCFGHVLDAKLMRLSMLKWDILTSLNVLYHHQPLIRRPLYHLCNNTLHKTFGEFGLYAFMVALRVAFCWTFTSLDLSYSVTSNRLPLFQLSIHKEKKIIRKDVSFSYFLVCRIKLKF